MRIMLVENEKIIPEALLTTMLEQNNCYIDIVYDCETALYRFGEKLFDLVVLDTSLRSTDRLTVLKEIRKKSSCS